MPLDLDTIVRVQPTARLLFDWILRHEFVERTTVEDLIEQLEIPRKAAITLLRSLADAGHGEFKVGRKGHPSRLEWSDDPHRLASRALGLEPEPGEEEEEDDPAPTPSDAAERTPTDEAPTRAGETSNEPAPARRGLDGLSDALIEHSYVLRPGLRVVVALPEDLSGREAEVLGDWVRNLSFER